MNTLKEKIDNALNLTSHTTALTSPFELLYLYSPFDIINRNLLNKRKHAYYFLKARSYREQYDRNQDRQEHYYNINDKVYLNSQNKRKLENPTDRTIFNNRSFRL